MPGCSITVITPLVKNSVKKAALPVTCQLDAPPPGINIAEAEFFDATGNPTSLALSGNNQSFVLPNTLPKGSGKLFVRVVGTFPPNAYVDVAEACTASNDVLCITDSTAKFGYCYLEVL